MNPSLSALSLVAFAAGCLAPSTTNSVATAPAPTQPAQEKSAAPVAAPAKLEPAATNEPPAKSDAKPDKAERKAARQEAKREAKAANEPAKPAQEEHWTQAELEKVSGEISLDIEKIRGEKFLRPVAVKLASKADLLGYIDARTAKTESPQKLAADEMTAKLLGVVPPSMDIMAATKKLLEGQVAGFYDPDSDSFSLMDTTSMGLARITMAHELDHALDDQLFDIDGTLAKCGTDSDAQLAFQSVVEGSGTAVMNLWTIEHMTSLDPKALQELSAMQADSAKDTPAWLVRPMLAVYMQGCAFLQRRTDWMAAQTGKASAADIRRAFEAPPRSTEQVLHPERYWDAKQIDEPCKLAYKVGALGAGWSVLREDTLGEFMTSIVVGTDAERAALDLSNAMSILGVSFGNDFAAGWGGDRLILLGNGDARVLRWTSVWDSERDAGEFFGALAMRKAALEAAAKELSKRDSGVTLEYGAARDEVVLTVHVGTKKRDLRDVLEAVAFERVK